MGFHLHPTGEVRNGDDMYTRGKTLLAVNLILACLFISTVDSLLASESGDAKELRFRSVRAMGMGNAFTAIANDGDAFYYNPAGLATIRNSRLDVQHAKFMISKDFSDQIGAVSDVVSDVLEISESDEPLKDPELVEERHRLMERLESLISDDFLLDIAFPVRGIVPFNVGDYDFAIGVMTHGWSILEFAVQRRGLDWDYPVYDVLDDEFLYRGMVEASYGMAAAVEIPTISLPLVSLPLELSFGLSVRGIRRWRMTDENDLLSAEDVINPDGADGIEGTADDFEERYVDFDDPWNSVAKGKGYSVDIGSIGTFNDAINVAVVIQNLFGHVDYGEDKDDELPLNFGVSTAVNLTRLAFSHTLIPDVILAVDVDRAEKSRLGLEVVWNLSALELSGRIGSNHGYMTLGVGIQLKVLDFDYAFYGDEYADSHAFSLNLAF